MKQLFVILLSLILSQSIFAANDNLKELITDCDKTPSALGEKAKYCVSKVKGVKHRDVLYYFHGIFGTAKGWSKEKFNRPIREQWSKLGYDGPLVVGISFGRAYLMNPQMGNKRSGLVEHTINKIIPYIENKLGIKPRNRYVHGLSMGAYNAIQLSMRYPETFDKVAIDCPPFTTIGPFATDEEIGDYIERTNAKKRKVRTALWLSKRHFDNQQEWDEESPLEFAKTKIPSNFPDFYMTVSMEDEFGFQEGGVLFADIAKNTVQNMEYHELEGEHCQTDKVSLANFIFRK